VIVVEMWGVVMRGNAALRGTAKEREGEGWQKEADTNRTLGVDAEARE
jgi:hypothetical protein